MGTETIYSMMIFSILLNVVLGVVIICYLHFSMKKSNQNIDWAKHLDKFIYNFTSRKFYGLIFFFSMQLLVVVTFMNFEPEEAKAMEFIFSGINYGTMAAFLIFVGYDGIQSFVDKKNKPE
jgi:hypothetical protein